MLAFVLTLAASLAFGQDYEYVTAADIASHATLEVADKVEPLEGLAITWMPEGPHLTVVVQNDTAGVVQVDWNSSAFVDPSGVACGIVPGTTMRKDYKAVTPSSMIPPGAKVKPPSLGIVTRLAIQ